MTSEISYMIGVYSTYIAFLFLIVYAISKSIIKSRKPIRFESVYKKTILNKFISLIYYLITWFCYLSITMVLLLWLFEKNESASFIIGLIFNSLYFIAIIALMFESFYIKLYEKELFIFVNINKQYTFDLDKVSIRYYIKKSIFRFNPVLVITDSEGEIIEVNCKSLGKTRFMSLINQLNSR